MLATKWSDGDPRDHWCVGFYDRCDARVSPPATITDPRYYVVDANGQQFRHNGFRRVKRISHERGKWLVDRMRDIELSGRSVWFFARCPMKP